MNDPGITFNEIINDAKGEPHSWECVPFNPDDGLSILQAVLQCVSAPLGALIGSAGPAQLDDAGEALSGLLESKLEGAELASAITGFVSEVQKQGGPRLIRRILSQARRDNRAMNNDVEYNRAFRANYSELFKAVWWVLVVNFRDALQVLKRPTQPGDAATPG